jgi:hypothetical protein
VARTWRDSYADSPPPRIRLFRSAHERLAALATEAGLGPADAIIHDLPREEVRGIWRRDRIIVIIDEIDDGGVARGSATL